MLETKIDLLNKLRMYADTPDDDTIRYKNIIKKTLLNCPELLYAFNDNELEKELFDDDGNLLIDEDGNLIGEVDRYFGDNSHIRPTLFIPDTQTIVNTYMCYQVYFNELPDYNNVQKYTDVAFNIFVNGKDRMDKLTGIPRHDLIASIIRERFNWSNIFGMQTHLISSKESITDNNFVVRTMVFQMLDTNGLYNTSKHGRTIVNNYQTRR